MSTELIDVAPEYTPIREALSLEALLKEVPIEQYAAVMQEEARKRYKAIGAGKKVFAIQNPALMQYQAMMGVRMITRVRPKYIGTLGGLKHKSGVVIEPSEWNEVNI